MIQDHEKKLFFLMLIFTIANLQAQNYQISFAGGGASTTVATVQVQNLSPAVAGLMTRAIETS